ncbi:transcriptional regulator [Listeria cornellensis FSL F6-0969]|uniref:Transcriptional regulator n=1 Tax=Listeria cornellensis FSL F6-0969 TaxID=1265820 RepID=W7C2A4_9LIST|nr:transcriptional regulator [Listeria cornellensis FSL F6-0969]
MDNVDLKLFTVLLRSAGWIQKLTAQLVEENGITPSEFGVLEQIYHLGPQQLQAIGQKNLISNGNTTYMVTKLEKKTICRAHNRSKRPPYRLCNADRARHNFHQQLISTV